MRKSIYVILVILCSSFSSTAVHYVGKSFWISFLQSDPGYKEMQCVVKISSEFFAQGSIKMKLPRVAGNPDTLYWEETFFLIPGIASTITIPAALQIKGKSGKIFPYAFYLHSSEEVFVTACNNSGNSSDAFIVLPVTSLSKEYMIAQYETSNKQFPTQYNVVATEDSTVFEIVNTAPDKNNNIKEDIQLFTLDQGEYLSIQSDFDLSGSKVRCINNKKIAVFSGVTCAYVPSFCQSCDHLVEQLLPVFELRNEFAIVNFAPRDRDMVRIMAKEDKTVFIVNGEPYVLEKAGKFIEIEIHGPVYVKSKKPLTVSHFTIGTACDRHIGDPSMVLVKPLGSFYGRVTLPVHSEDNVTAHYVNIVLNTEDIPLLKINGKKPRGEFEVFAAANNLSFIRVKTGGFNNTISCDCNYTFTAYGFGYFESYAY